MSKVDNSQKNHKSVRDVSLHIIDIVGLINLRFISLIPIAILALVMLATSITYNIRLNPEKVSSKKSINKISHKIVNTATHVTVSPNIQASDIIVLFNQQRSNLKLIPLVESQQLDNAAILRAQDMINNNYLNNTEDNPASFIRASGYIAGDWSLQSTYNQTSAQTVVDTLENDNSPSSFIGNQNVSNIGVGVVPDTISGNKTQLVVIYLASTCQVGYMTCAAFCLTIQNDEATTISQEQSSLNDEVTYLKNQAALSNLPQSTLDYELNQTYINHNTENQSTYKGYLMEVSGVPNCTVDYPPPVPISLIQ